MSGMPDPYVLAFLLAVGMAVLLMYSRLLAALQGAGACCRGYHGTVEMLGNSYVCDSVRIIFMLLIPFYALALDLCQVSAVGYAWTLAALVGLWIFRKLVYLILGWLTGRPSGFRSLERVSYALGLLMMLCAMPAVLLALAVAGLAGRTGGSGVPGVPAAGHFDEFSNWIFCFFLGFVSLRP